MTIDTAHIRVRLGGGVAGQTVVGLCDEIDRLRSLLEQQPRAVPFDCFSDNDGDTWRDCPDDAEFVHGLKLGDQFELLAGWNAVPVKFVVTKAPDDESDDYKVEQLQAAPPPPEQAEHDAMERAAIEIEGGNEWITKHAASAIIRRHMAQAEPSTPAAKWRQNGEPDPHGNEYDCERAKLAMGHLSDDELANAVFIHGNMTPPLQDVISGKAKMPIAYLTAAKDRIRWLSRELCKAQAAGGVGLDMDAAHQKAFELGGTELGTAEEGNYYLSTDDLEAVIKAALLAQPQPENPK